MRWRDAPTLTTSSTQRAVLLTLALAFCLLLLNRWQLQNGYVVLQGDRYDGIIVTTILEHWLHVLSGSQNWAEAGYFFPYTRTIAQTDGYFLIGLAYAPFRWLGLDPFMATDLATNVIKAIGFGGAYLMCRRMFALPFFWSLLAAVLFTLNNAMTSHTWRVQLATVALVPVMALLLWEMTCALLDGATARMRRWGIGAALLYGAWCMTCFYMAWFFALFAAFFAMAMAICSERAERALLARRLAEQYRSVLLVLAVLALSMIPFVYAFLPKASEVGVRAFSEVLPYLVQLPGVIRVGTENWLLGGVVDRVLHVLAPEYQPQGEYANMGIEIFLLILFVVGCAHLLRVTRKNGGSIVLRAMILATIETWLLILRVGDRSPWYLIYQVVPGAKALRAVSTYQILLALPIVIVAVSYLSRRRLGLPIALPLAALLVVAELNTPHVQLYRHAELTRIALPHPAPAACKVFYVSGWSIDADGGPLSLIYGHNVSAMLIAQSAGIPTINGVASFNPPDWNFDHPERPDYEARVRAYAVNHRIEGLCRLDLDNKQWSTVALALPPSTDRPLSIAFNQAPAAGEIAAVAGLSGPEPWGTWSDGDRVSLTFAAPLPRRFSLRLIGRAFGPNAAKAFVLRVGGQKVRFALSENPVAVQFEFDNPGRAQRIDIEVPAAVSPKSVGMSADERRLGIGLVALRIDPIGAR